MNPNVKQQVVNRAAKLAAKEFLPVTQRERDIAQRAAELALESLQLRTSPLYKGGDDPWRPEHDPDNEAKR